MVVWATMLISLVLMGISSICHAWTTGTHHTAFRSSNTAISGVPPTMYIDSVSDVKPFRFLKSFLSPSRPTASKPPIDETRRETTQTAMTSTHGMPWKESICANYTAENDHLFYMPFWEWQMQYMTKHLTNLRAVSVVSRSGRDMSYIQNNPTPPPSSAAAAANCDQTPSSQPTMRMHTCCFTSDEYKLIRLTVLDAGWRTQVFTSLWYPAETTDPVLGIDLLQFNHAKKHLCIVDYQPVVPNDGTDGFAFEALLRPIREQYPSLQGEMTDRFYNREDSYFSNQMLLGRHNTLSAPGSDHTAPSPNDTTAHSMVYDDLFPAFQQYVASHVAMVQTNQQARTSTTNAATIQACHQAYDTYSAARDPAHGLLARCFGQDWADEYVYDILFPLAIPETAMP